MSQRLVTFAIPVYMKMMIRQLILTVLYGLLALSVSGQTVFNQLPADNVCKPPKNRELFHDWVNQQQANLFGLDGKADSVFAPSADKEINYLLQQSATLKIDILQCRIENDTLLNDQGKKKYLRGLKNLLEFFISNVATRKVSPLHLPDIINGFEKCYLLDREGKSISQVADAYPYETAYSIVNADNTTFEKNPGLKAAKQAVVLKYCVLHPSKTLPTLFQNPGMPFADSMVRLVAKSYPKQLYNYAQSNNNQLGFVIRNINDDDFIRTVVKMARSKSGMQYFPFLDNIVNGKMSLEEIDAAKDDSLLYYRLLVKTQIEYVKRAQDKDTAFEFESLTQRLIQKAKESFVNVINGLHNEEAPVRFASIQPLTPEELYYLAVSSDGSIYTSSFVRGVYPLIMKKVNNKGDSLLMTVHFDKYRKFIKMCAGYNTLDNFLSSFPKAEQPGDENRAETLMRAFVKNLEKSNGPEDAVDVADSYASIAETLKPLADEMLMNVDENYIRNEKQNNKKGMAVYRILKYLFLSADSTKKIDLTKELGIPPVYEVPYKSMQDDSGRVYVQVFFYGDKDGQGVFNGFVKQFSNANWKVDAANPQWITVNSVKGKPVTIFANKALPEETGEDEKAQEALCEYIEKNKFYPAVTIHRGHSYYADATINQMFPSSKIVFLGSCGGYHLIHRVLETAPEAHIIASKQIGATAVNRPFIDVLADRLRNGKDIYWMEFWETLDKIVNVPEFADYIPPYKNLGALYIKAYKLAMGEEAN